MAGVCSASRPIRHARVTSSAVGAWCARRAEGTTLMGCVMPSGQWDSRAMMTSSVEVTGVTRAGGSGHRESAIKEPSTIWLRYRSNVKIRILVPMQ